MIHYISPYRSDKNIGKAINDAVGQLLAGSDDWIVHVDQDAMWLRSDGKKQLEEILAITDADILGPVTNRLAANTQLVSGMFEQYDIREHLKRAAELNEKYYGQVWTIREPLAAFCLCFRVSTWEKLNGFMENMLQFDWYFSQQAMEQGLRLGLMPGIYVYHLYRSWVETGAKDHIDHLV